MPGLRALHLAVCKGVNDAAARQSLTDPRVLPHLEDLDLTHVPLSRGGGVLCFFAQFVHYVQTLGALFQTSRPLPFLLTVYS